MSGFRYRKTNFYTNGYEGFNFGASGKIGVRLFDYPKDWNYEDGRSKLSVHIMPYAKAEVTLSEKNYFLKNRAIGSAEIRIMPRIKITEEKDLLLRFYGEYINVIDYFEDGPNSKNPWENIRFGINFSINRY